MGETMTSRSEEQSMRQDTSSILASGTSSSLTLVMYVRRNHSEN